MDVDTRVLRYFVAVAERLSFTRAAEELFVSQPALSRQIRQLENDLRLVLFARSSRAVRLTPAGEALLPAARTVVASWRDARLAAHAAAASVVRVGFSATGGGLLGTQAHQVFADRHPGVTVEPKRFDWGGEAEAVRSGQVDVAFLWLPADTTGLHVSVVAVEPRVVGLPRTHPLVSRAEVDILELRDEPLVWTRKAPRAWVDWWAVNPRPDGSAPVWGPENDNVEEMLEHVAAGAAVCISPASMAAYYARPDLVWRSIRDVPPLRIAVAWPSTSRSPVVAAFVAVVRELSEADGAR